MENLINMNSVFFGDFYDAFKFAANLFARFARGDVIGIGRDADGGKLQLLHQRDDHLARAGGVTMAAVGLFDTVANVPKVIQLRAFAKAKADIAHLAPRLSLVNVKSEAVGHADLAVFHNFG